MGEKKRDDKNETEEKVLLSWRAPARAFKKRNKEFFTTIAIIVFLISFICVLIGEWFFVAAILSLTFLVYVLSTVPPEEIENKISNLGVKNKDNFYKWEDLKDFWFEDRYGMRVLMMETKQRPFSLLGMVLKGVDEEKVKEVLKGKIKYRGKMEKNSLDKMSDWLSKKISFES